VKGCFNSGGLARIPSAHRTDSRTTTAFSSAKRPHRTLSATARSIWAPPRTCHMFVRKPSDANLLRKMIGFADDMKSFALCALDRDFLLSFILVLGGQSHHGSMSIHQACRRWSFSNRRKRPRIRAHLCACGYRCNAAEVFYTGQNSRFEGSRSTIARRSVANEPRGLHATGNSRQCKVGMSEQAYYYDPTSTLMPEGTQLNLVSWNAFPNRLNQYFGTPTALPPNPHNLAQGPIWQLADQGFYNDAAGQRKLFCFVIH
jgi:hypothetical protein